MFSDLLAALRNPALAKASDILDLTAHFAHSAAQGVILMRATPRLPGPLTMGGVIGSWHPDRRENLAFAPAREFTMRVLQGHTLSECWDLHRAPYALNSSWAFAPVYNHAAQETPYLGFWDLQDPSYKEPVVAFFEAVHVLMRMTGVEILPHTP